MKPVIYYKDPRLEGGGGEKISSKGQLSWAEVLSATEDSVSIVAKSRRDGLRAAGSDLWDRLHALSTAIKRIQSAGLELVQNAYALSLDLEREERRRESDDKTKPR